jgi:hypothetical protein
MRFLFDGFQHRWNKWVLDYDLEKQFELVRGATDAFSGGESATATEASDVWRRAALAALVAVILLVLVRWIRGRRTPVLKPASVIYLRLRSAYERAGVAHANLAPLAFSELLSAGDAPGAREAERVVAAYVRVRFGGSAPDEPANRTMRQDAAAALAALRRERRRRLFSRRPADRASADASAAPPTAAS